MKVPVEATVAPEIWKEGGTTATLRVENLKGFTSSLGQFVPPSNGNAFYLEIPITITGDVPLISGFEIDSTDDAVPWDSDVIGDVPGYRFTIVTNKNKVIPYFPQCRIPTLADGDPSITWAELRILNRARARKVIPQRFIPETLLDAKIGTAVGDLNKASSTNTGGTALSVDPVDPLFPVAVGNNDPDYLSLFTSQSLNFFRAEDFGAVGDGVTDDSAAIQAAINAAVLLGVSVIKFGAGVFLVDGALQGTAPYQARLILPFIDPAGNEAVHITIEGVGPPPLAFGSVNSTFQAATKGTIFKSTLNTGAMWGCATLGSTFTEAELTMRNLTIRLPDNPGQKGIEGSFLGGLHLDHVNIDTGRYTTAVVQPTNADGIGIVTPLNNNNANQTFEHVQIQGFYLGMTWNEHNIGEHIVITGCRTGMDFLVANHASYLKRLMVFNNTFNLRWSGIHVAKIEELDIEHADSVGLGTPVWQDTTYDIDDGSSNGRGIIEWHVVKGGVGLDATFLVNGGTLMKYRRLFSKGFPFFGHFNSSVPLTLPDTTPTALALDTDVDDIYGLHDPVTNNTRISFSTTAFNGNPSLLLRLTIAIDFAANAVGYRSVIAKVNGTTFLVEGGELTLPVPGQITRLNISCSRKFLKTDYVEVFAAQTSGGNLDVVNINVLVEEVEAR